VPREAIKVHFEDDINSLKQGLLKISLRSPDRTVNCTAESVFATALLSIPQLILSSFTLPRKIRQVPVIARATGITTVKTTAGGNYQG